MRNTQRNFLRNSKNNPFFQRLRSRVYISNIKLYVALHRIVRRSLSSRYIYIRNEDEGCPSEGLLFASNWTIIRFSRALPSIDSRRARARLSIVITGKTETYFSALFSKEEKKISRLTISSCIIYNMRSIYRLD